MGSPFGLWSPTPPTRRLLFHRGATPPPVSGPPPADQSLSLAALSNTRLAAGPAVVRLASLVPRQAQDGLPSGVEGRSLTTIPSEGEGPRKRPPSCAAGGGTIPHRVRRGVVRPASPADSFSAEQGALSTGVSGAAGSSSQAVSGCFLSFRIARHPKTKRHARHWTPIMLSSLWNSGKIPLRSI